MGNHLPPNGIYLASTKTHELSVSADSNTAGGFENGNGSKMESRGIGPFLDTKEKAFLCITMHGVQAIVSFSIVFKSIDCMFIWVQ